MTSKTLILSAIVLVPSFSAANPVGLVFVAEEGNWNVADNWDDQRVPDPNDFVIFPGGVVGVLCHVTTTSDIASSFAVEGDAGGDAQLNIKKGAQVEFTNQLSMGSILGGLITFDSQPSQAQNKATLKFSADTTVVLGGTVGSAAIEGAPGDGKIVGPGRLTIDDAVTAKGSIEISAPFTNDGTVDANGTVTDKDIILTATSEPRGDGVWKVTGALAKLWFLASATTLQGDFFVEDGTLKIDDNVTSTGDLVFTGGKIEVAQGGEFKANAP